MPDTHLAPLMAHLVLGHPTLEASVATARRYAAAGVRYLELQLPFSHPTADGVTITQANRAALAATPAWEDYWKSLEALTAELSPARLVIMTYANRVVGAPERLDAFAARMRQLGLTRLIVPDLPLDSPPAQALLAHGLELIPVLAANTPSSRLDALLAHQPSFVYLMGGYRLTGQAFDLDPRLATLVAEVKRRVSHAEVGIGFGVSSAADVAAIRRVADVAIVGSALIQAAERGTLDALLSELAHATVSAS